MPLRRKRTFSRRKRAPTKRRTKRRVVRRKSKAYTSSRVRSTGQRRATTMRRSGAGGRRMAIPSEHRDSVMAMLNPFANRSGAKRPDGAVPESHALSHRISAQITCAPVPETPDTFGGGVTHIVMIPGLHCGAIGMNGNGTGTDTPYLPGYYKWATDSFIDGKFQGNAATATTINEFNIQGSINKWRVVSQGMRLKLLNTFEKNDGWFQSVRLNYKLNLAHWEVYAGLTGGIAGETVLITNDTSYMRPTKQLIIDECLNKELAEHKSYTCGSLAEIGNFQWDLGSYSRNNEFNNIREKYILPNGAITPVDAPGPGPDALAKLVSGYNQGAALYDATNDSHYDLIYIRIFPGAAGSNLLADLVSHHEVCYDLDTPLAKFMTANKTMSAELQKAVDDLADLKKTTAGTQGHEGPGV